MMNLRLARPVLAAMVVLLTLLAFTLPGVGDPAFAKPPVEDPPATDTVYFDPGVACEGFGVQLDTTYTHEVYRYFYDKEGNLERGLVVTKGTLVFTNMSTRAEVTVPLHGSVFHDQFGPDGALTGSVLTGNFGVVLFPTDVFADGMPAGPSTRMYSGRMEFTVGENGVWTVHRVSGKSRDICAELAG